METQKNIFEKVTVTSLDIIKAAGSLTLELFKLHLLSPVSDHFAYARNMVDDPHPFDAELYDIPEETQLMLDYYTLEE